jgi:hypothetical protein
MQSFLRERDAAKMHFPNALRIAAEAWTVGHMSLGEDVPEELPAHAKIIAHRDEQLTQAAVECAVLDRTSPLPMTWRAVSEEESRARLRGD